MSRVITFSRTFPAYHPKAGQPTYFVEKLWNSIYAGQDREVALISHELGGIWSGWCEVRESEQPKHHTIRGGHRFKVGDKFSPRVWSGKPYNSKQIIIAPDIEVKKTFDFVIDILGGEYRMNGVAIHIETLKLISMNDGFSELDDFELWFNVKRGEGFIGQIICWNENVNY